MGVTRQMIQINLSLSLSLSLSHTHTHTHTHLCRYLALMHVLDASRQYTTMAYTFEVQAVCATADARALPAHTDARVHTYACCVSLVCTAVVHHTVSRATWVAQGQAPFAVTSISEPLPLSSPKKVPRLTLLLPHAHTQTHAQTRTYRLDHT